MLQYAVWPTPYPPPGYQGTCPCGAPKCGGRGGLGTDGASWRSFRSSYRSRGGDARGHEVRLHLAQVWHTIGSQINSETAPHVLLGAEPVPRDSYGWGSYRTLQVRWLRRYLLMALLLESCGATAPPAQSRTTHTDNDYTEQDSPRVLRAFDASVVLGLGSAERVSGRMASVTCGDDIGCATDEAGQAYCWGRSRVDTPAMPAGVLHRSPTRIEVGAARRVQGHPLCVEGWTSQLRCWRTNRFEEFPWRVRSFDISRSGCVISLDGVLRCSALAHPEPILEQPPPAAFLPMAIPEPVVDVADSGASSPLTNRAQADVRVLRPRPAARRAPCDGSPSARRARWRVAHSGRSGFAVGTVAA